MRQLLWFVLMGCGAQTPPEEDSLSADVAAEVIEDAAESGAAESDVAESDAPVGRALANVINVEVQGSNLAVTIESPDTGCDQYANWWELVTEDGALVYRRILGHSHVAEQPFTRSGGPVEVATDTVLVVRAHMHPGGYGGAAFRGTLAEGFATAALETGFATSLSEEAPLPQSCAF